MIRFPYKSVSVWLLTLAVCLSVHGQNREILGEYKIGIVGRDQEDVIYQATHLGAQNAARELSEKFSIDVELLVLTPNVEQGANQHTSMAELFIEDADGLIISPSSFESVRPAIEFAIQQGQEVVLFENELKGLQPLAAILANEEEAGRLAGKIILSKLPTKGRVAILTSESPDSALKSRLDGLRATLGFRRIQTIVTCKPDYLSAIEAIRATEEADRNDLIKGWVFLDDWPLLGLPALPWKPGELPTVAIQSSPSAFIYIDQGYVDALVVHPYYEWGYSSVETMVNKLHNSISPQEPEILTTPRIINWDNVNEYRENWKTWLK
jgi:ribose transport system substrate-binding protein